MYVYFLCGLVCICIHESDAELICVCVCVGLFVVFFLRRFNVLCYASGFFVLFLRHVFMMHVCVCVCVYVCVCVCVCV